MKGCRNCGVTCRIGDICGLCRRDPSDRALPKGQWVGGLVKKYVHWTPPHMPAHTLGHTCGCGCLLLNAAEPCPACELITERNAA